MVKFLRDRLGSKVFLNKGKRLINSSYFGKCLFLYVAGGRKEYFNSPTVKIEGE